jgi:hypothetical protein
VHHDGDGGFFRGADYGLQFGLRVAAIDPHGVAVPLLHFFGLTGGALLRHPAGFVFDRLFFEMVESFADSNGHVLGLSQSDDGAIARADGDFGFVAMLLDGEDDFAVESVAQNFADFCEAGLYFFADAGSNYVVSASVFHVHERPL